MNDNRLEGNESGTRNHFNSDEIMVLKNDSLAYKNRIFSYFAVIGVFISVIAKDEYNLYKFLSEWAVVGFAIGILILVDRIVESIFANQWKKSVLGDKNTLSANAMENICAVQSFLHLIVTILALVGGLSFSNGYIRADNEIKKERDGMIGFQNALEQYFYDNHKMPIDLEHLLNESQAASDFYIDLEKQPLKIFGNRLSNYQIVFSGLDRKFSTKDDVKVNYILRAERLPTVNGEVKPFSLNIKEILEGKERKVWMAMGDIQDEVEKSIKKYGFLHKDILSELSKNHSYQLAVKELEWEPMSIIGTNLNDYLIIFSGEDYQLNTSDDLKFDSHVRVKDVWNMTIESRIEKERSWKHQSVE